MEHAVRHEIHVKLEEDPAYYQSLRERLEQVIEDRKHERLDAADQLSLLQRLVDDVRGQSRAAEGVDMSETAYAIYGLLKGGQLNRVMPPRPTPREFINGETFLYAGRQYRPRTTRLTRSSLGRLNAHWSNVLVRDQRARWGFAVTKGNLRFNWRIVRAPTRLLDYVVAHELVHLLHADHTREFWATLGRAMPDYEIRREKLRQPGRTMVW